MAILDTSEPPTYQRIAGKAAHLRELGLSAVVIARRLGVSDKTVAKAIDWVHAFDSTAHRVRLRALTVLEPSYRSGQRSCVDLCHADVPRHR